VTRTIKKSAIPLTGYVYQNLAGLGVLCDWIEDPTLYRWVVFECDEEDGHYQGLDDVVAQRPDGSMVLIQVKFTVDADDENNLLSWNWLLQHRPKGKSLVQKWEHAFSESGSRGPVDAYLLTNRRPDREFKTCLSREGDAVDLAKVPPEVLERLSKQVGSEQLQLFFSGFRFQHSRENYRALERTTLDRFVPRHTSMYGWLLLRHEAIYWASHIAAPPPEGRITLSYLRGLLNQSRPKPLEQGFRVPLHYEPPNTVFFDTFINRVAQTPDRPLILWGSPGQGKSTFLSYMCGELDRRGVPYIRHHYFLALGDTEDRFTLASVANSLMAQIEAKHSKYVEGLSTQPEHLRKWISACAQGYGEHNKPFVVVIDGLDHVWREHDGNKAPLDSLFAQLFPLPENLVLVMGSQRVDPSHLPQNFIDHVMPSDWIELPRMSIASTVRWLQTMFNAQRFELLHSPEDPDKAITNIAQAFHDVSDGHPLILTYSFEQLIRNHRQFGSREVREHVTQTDGDIGRYYTALWHRLTFDARDALHLLADSGFVWPINGLEECLSIRGGILHREIGHLVHVTEAGIMAFHGSLLVFAASQSDHCASLGSTLSKVIEWLAKRAPPFHKWGWLWLYQARAGNQVPLLANPSRNWAVDSIALGYPTKQLVAILEAAEKIAFSSNDFAKAIRLRWLETEILNGPEFQIADFRRVTRCAFELGSDDYPSRLMAAHSYVADEYDLYLLALFALARGNPEAAQDYQKQLRARINDKAEAGAYKNLDFEQAILRYLDLSARTRVYNPETIASNIQRLGSQWREFLAAFTERLGSEGELSKLVELHSQPGWEVSQKGSIELEIIRTSGRTIAAIECWPEYSSFVHHPIVACWTKLYGHKSTEWKFACRSPDTSSLSYDLQLRQIEGHLYDVFFQSLAQALCEGPTLEFESLKPNQMWLEAARKELLAAAAQIAVTLRRGEPVPFSRVYRLTESVKQPKFHDAHSERVSFRRALLSIASDLFVLSMRRSGQDCIPDDDWKGAKASNYFVVDQWINAAESARVPPLSKVSAERLIADQLDATAGSITPFNERVEKYLDLCEFAQLINVHGQAQELLRRAVDCIVGYGWRKNDKLYDTMAAVEALASARPTEACDLLKRLSPIATEISEMTEDDAFRPFQLAPLVLKVMPSRFPALYGQWLEQSDWYYAEHSLKPLLESLDLNAPIAGLLANTIWDPVGIAALRENKRSTPSAIGRTILINASRFGYAPEQLPVEREYSSNIESEEPLDSSVYGANDLNRLITDAGGSRSSAQVALLEWFDRSVQSGDGLTALRALEEHRADDSWLSPVAVLFDKAFHESLKLEGKKAAYKWLVTAHINRQGWDRFYDDETHARFDLIARYYPKIWRDFVHGTSKSPYRSSLGLVIPTTRLVELMIKVGELDDAVAVTEAMVDSVVESFSDQPLRMPAWLGVESPHA
jgi:hypothetical protein